jgi:hypothetical protein
LSKLLEDTETLCYAWSLIPNHCHLLPHPIINSAKVFLMILVLFCLSSLSSYAGVSAIPSSKSIFIVVGDTQKTTRWEFWRKRNNKERKMVMDEIGRREPAFVVHLGDLTAYGGSKRHWDDFDQVTKTIREKKIPFLPILGNHDYYGNNKTALSYYFDRFPAAERKRWYSIRWKTVGLVMVDSNFSNMSSEEAREQEQWYLRELRRFEEDEGITSVVVFCHHAPFTNSSVVCPDDEAKVRFANPFLSLQKTRLFFGGHTHSYERFQIGAKFFIVAGGGGGPRHKVFTEPGKRRFEDLFAGPEIRPFHFVEIELNEAGLTSRDVQLQADGCFRVIDPFTVE